MEFHPNRAVGLLAGGTIIACLLTPAGLLVMRLLETPLSLTFLAYCLVALALAGLAGIFVFWCYGCWSLSYVVDRNQLTLNWGSIKQIIPMQAIQKLCPGTEINGRLHIRGINWPGHHVGKGSVEGLGETLVYCTHVSPKDVTYVMTPTVAYAISPMDPRAFAAELRIRQHLGPIQTVRQHARRWPWTRWAVWHDPWVWLLVALALMVNVLLFAYVLYFYPSLPELIRLHFTPLGEVDRVGMKGEVLTLPGFAAAVWALNAVLGLILHARERAATYILLGGAVFVQLVLWVATLSIVGRSVSG